MATRTGRALRALRLPITLVALLVVVPSALAQGGGEIRAEGPIAALTDSSLTVGLRTFAVTAATRVTDDDHQPILFSALTVGTDVEVEGRLLLGGRALALTIEVEDGPGDDHPHGLRAEGLVLARTDSSLAVGGLTFAVTPATRVRGHGTVTYADVQVGTSVEVRGSRTAAGALVADEIRIENRPGSPGSPGGGHGGTHGGLRVEGLIQTVSADSLTVRNRTFALTDSTVIVGDGRQPFPAESLAVGLRVEVSGQLLADGTLVARMVEVEDGDHHNDLRLRGAIEVLTATGLTVSGRAVAVTAQTAVYGADRQPIAFSALVVGQMVEIHATVGTAGALTATRITVEAHGTFEQEVRVRAALDATGDSLAVVLGRPFAVRRFTRILGLNRAPVALASLPVGGLVEVRARRDADGQLVAFLIAAQSGDAATVSLTADVTDVSADSVSVLGVPFAAAGAVVTTRTGAPATLADVAVGQTVRLTGTAAAAGFTATRIEIRRAAQAMGRVASAQGGQITLAGVAVATSTETLFVMEDGTATTAAAASAGADLLVSGTVTATGTLDASQVVVLTASRTTAAGDAPAAVALASVFPNPTSGAATLRYSVATSADVRVSVVDVLGRTVLTATDGPASAGDHEVRLDTAALPAGVYVVRLSVGGQATG
ncbi:MAG TPA: DUF5666 domain-containing protein, partial [Rubricoccaceae bacterium]